MGSKVVKLTGPNGPYSAEETSAILQAFSIVERYGELDENQKTKIKCCIRAIRALGKKGEDALIAILSLNPETLESPPFSSMKNPLCLTVGLLERLRSTRSIPALVNALDSIERIQKEPKDKKDLALAVYARMALRELPVASTPFLLDYVRNEQKNPTCRSYALEILSEFAYDYSYCPLAGVVEKNNGKWITKEEYDDIKSLVCELLNDPNSELRVHAAGNLYSVTMKKSKLKLLYPLLKDPDDKVVMSAINVLATHRVGLRRKDVIEGFAKLILNENAGISWFYLDGAKMPKLQDNLIDEKGSYHPIVRDMVHAAGRLFYYRKLTKLSEEISNPDFNNFVWSGPSVLALNKEFNFLVRVSSKKSPPQVPAEFRASFDILTTRSSELLESIMSWDHLPPFFEDLASFLLIDNADQIYLPEETRKKLEVQRTQICLFYQKNALEKPNFTSLRSALYNLSKLTPHLKEIPDEFVSNMNEIIRRIHDYEKFGLTFQQATCLQNFAQGISAHLISETGSIQSTRSPYETHFIIHNIPVFRRDAMRATLRI